MFEEKENYLELLVPIRRKAKWFDKLRNAMESEGVPVKWQNTPFHITAVFMNDNKDVVPLQAAFAKHLTDRKAPMLTIDTLDAFKTGNGKEYIVCLKSSKLSSQPSDELGSLIGELRNEAKSIGANINPNFFIHITLGRIDAGAASLERIKDIISQINIPTFSLSIKDAEYRYKKGCLICNWQMK